ncbi:hypothetical protein FRC11_011465, partial [Ceratobasidium sp. 423]
AGDVVGHRPPTFLFSWITQFSLIPPQNPFGASRSRLKGLEPAGSAAAFGRRLDASVAIP